MDNRNNQVLYTPTQKAAPAVADLSSFYQIYYDLFWTGDSSSGDIELTLDPTPTGFIRIVTGIVIYDSVSAIDKIRLGMNVSGEDVWIKSVVNLSAGQGVSFSGHIFLDEGSYIKTLLNGCTAGDNLLLSALGYDIKKY